MRAQASTGKHRQASARKGRHLHRHAKSSTAAPPPPCQTAPAPRPAPAPHPPPHRPRLQQSAGGETQQGIRGVTSSSCRVQRLYSTAASRPAAAYPAHALTFAGRKAGAHGRQAAISQTKGIKPGDDVSKQRHPCSHQRMRLPGQQRSSSAPAAPARSSFSFSSSSGSPPSSAAPSAAPSPSSPVPSCRPQQEQHREVGGGA